MHIVVRIRSEAPFLNLWEKSPRGWNYRSSKEVCFRVFSLGSWQNCFWASRIRPTSSPRIDSYSTRSSPTQHQPTTEMTIVHVKRMIVLVSLTLRGAALINEEVVPPLTNPSSFTKWPQPRKNRDKSMRVCSWTNWWRWELGVIICLFRHRCHGHCE